MVLKPPAIFGQEPEIEMENKNHALLEISVANALASSGGINAADVSVVAEGAGIVLSGVVATAAEIERAAEVAMAVQGVASVKNNLKLG